MGYYIKIWDAYRPFAAQEKLWQVCPNPRYVANPANGMKAHNLGGTIDMTLVTFDGNEVGNADGHSMIFLSRQTVITVCAGNSGRKR